MSDYDSSEAVQRVRVERLTAALLSGEELPEDEKISVEEFADAVRAFAQAGETIEEFAERIRTGFGYGSGQSDGSGRGVSDD